MKAQNITPSKYCTDAKQLYDFVADKQVVAESAKVCALTAVGFMVRQEYAGSWWSLPEASRLYNALQIIRDNPSVLVCRLLAGRVTYVHENSWEPLLALENCLPDGALDRVVEHHLKSGKHEVLMLRPAEWAPVGIRQRAAHLTRNASISLLRELVEPTTWNVINRTLK